jgi:uncharacterized membrane protein
MSGDVDPSVRRGLRSASGLRTREVVRRSFVSGLGVVIPLVVTLVVLGLVLDFLSGTLNPLVGVVHGLTPNRDPSAVLIQLVAVVSLLALVFVVGLLSEFGPGEGRLAAGLEDVITSVPGIGSVYTSFDEMSDLLLDSDTNSFQEVKLVEYPHEGSYTVAFKTADTTETISAATGNGEMVTLFMPMAPNPVMGGFVVHVSADRVVDVDMTVEEGIRSIVTSGVTAGRTDDPDGLSGDALRELGDAGRAGDDPRAGRTAVEPTTNRERYEAERTPADAPTPKGVTRRADHAREDGPGGRP